MYRGTGAGPNSPRRRGSEVRSPNLLTSNSTTWARPCKRANHCIHHYVFNTMYIYSPQRRFSGESAHFAYTKQHDRWLALEQEQIAEFNIIYLISCLYTRRRERAAASLPTSHTPNRTTGGSPLNKSKSLSLILCI